MRISCGTSTCTSIMKMSASVRLFACIHGLQTCRKSRVSCMLDLPDVLLFLARMHWLGVSAAWRPYGREVERPKMHAQLEQWQSRSTLTFHSRLLGRQHSIVLHVLRSTSLTQSIEHRLRMPQRSAELSKKAHQPQQRRLKIWYPACQLWRAGVSQKNLTARGHRRTAAPRSAGTTCTTVPRVEHERKQQ